MAAMTPPAERTRLLSPQALLVDAGAALPSIPVLDPPPLAVAVVAPPTAPGPVPVAGVVTVASISVPVLCAVVAAEDEGETSDTDVGMVAIVLGELPEQISFQADEA